jgi:monoamine oxidase
MKYDVVITGSGLGGLQCAYILSHEGYNVCLIEKNPQLGGCLQTFRRNNIVFDTGMHYIGGMDEGQVLNNFFRYFKLSGKLKLRKLDENAYDIVRFGGKEYKFAMGYECPLIFQRKAKRYVSTSTNCMKSAIRWICITCAIFRSRKPVTSIITA